MAEPLKVGDVGVVKGPERWMHPWDGEVVKLGRRWAVVKNTSTGWPADGKFDIETGHAENRDGIGPTIRFVTAERAAEEEQVAQAVAMMREVRLSFDHGSGSYWKPADIVALGDWLTARFTVAETTHERTP